MKTVFTNPEDVLLENLAASEHTRWGRWQQHLHDKCSVSPDGSLTIPPDLVARWERQIATSYAELSEVEKESDREEARRTMDIFWDAIESVDFMPV